MLRQPARRRRSKSARAVVRPLPAPWRGLNTRDRLEEAEPGYATILENFIPGSSKVTLRNGHKAHASGLPDLPVESLMECAIGADPVLFAAVGDKIFDVTKSGDVGAAALSGFSNARWQHTMYATTSGQHLVCVNGADGLWSFDGNVWTQRNLIGVDPATLAAVAAHKYKLWFIPNEGLKAWYLQTLSIAGEASFLDLGPIAKKGGSLQAISGWSVDAGDGADDYLVFVTSEGECIVFAGTDPNSETSWSHIGTYQTDRPIGQRCLAKFGADLLILTTSGVVSVSALLNTNSRWAALSELVRADFQSPALSKSDLFGWEIHHYAKKGWLIANVPSGNGQFTQLIYNSLLPPPDGWGLFKGQNAHCWGYLNGDIYFGGRGQVCKADFGGDDAGEEIVGRTQWGWTRLGSNSMKRFTLAKPYMQSDVKPDIKLAMCTDYDTALPKSEPTIASVSDAARWNAAEWNVAAWANKADIYSPRVALSGVGTVAGLHLTYASRGAEFSITGAEIGFETGGGL